MSQLGFDASNEDCSVSNVFWRTAPFPQFVYAFQLRRKSVTSMQTAALSISGMGSNLSQAFCSRDVFYTMIADQASASVFIASQGMNRTPGSVTTFTFGGIARYLNSGLANQDSMVGAPLLVQPNNLPFRWKVDTDPEANHRQILQSGVVQSVVAPYTAVTTMSQRYGGGSACNLPFAGGTRTLLLATVGGAPNIVDQIGLNAASIQAISLGADPNNTNTPFQLTASYGGGNNVWRIGAGFIVTMPNVAPIFGNIGKGRYLFITSDLGSWFDVNIVGIDTNAVSLIAQAPVNGGSIKQNVEGAFFFKLQSFGAPGNSILVNTPPAPPFLPPGYRGTIPAYWDYDMPYGMEFK